MIIYQMQGSVPLHKKPLSFEEGPMNLNISLISLEPYLFIDFFTALTFH